MNVLGPDSTSQNNPPRSIAIIGAGLTGVGYLAGFLDLPLEARKGWTIDCYEKRESAGGIWHPQPNPPAPPTEPETPMYDNFECITLCNGMTFPGHPLPPSTPLFCSDQPIDAYIQKLVKDLDLESHIHLGSAITSLSLSHPDSRDPWTVGIEQGGVTRTRRYSTIIVASGVTPVPRFLTVPGREDWLSGHPDRSIVHSMWYRNPEFVRDRTVIIVGRHPSGYHLAQEVQQTARKVYHVYSPDPLSANFPAITPSPKYTVVEGRVISLSGKAIHLDNGKTVETPGEAILIECTGYSRPYPLLRDCIRNVSGGDFAWDDLQLETNDRYIRPLYQAILPLDPKIPLGSLAFGCLYPIIWNLPTSYGQGLWFGHLMANLDIGSNILPSTDDCFKEVRQAEMFHQKIGIDPTKRGYIIVPFGKATDDRADALIESVRKGSRFALPSSLKDRPFTEPWRRRAFEVVLGLIKAWQEAKRAGVAYGFSEGAVTEDDYAKAVERMVEWWDGQKDKPEDWH